MKEEKNNAAFLALLKEELIVSFGCTEPAAVAYAVSLATSNLDEETPLKIEVLCSSNIIKNVKSVVVPHTGGLIGLPVAVAAGVVAKQFDLKLEILSAITEEMIPQIKEIQERCEIIVGLSDSTNSFDIQVFAKSEKHQAVVHITGFHTNIVYISKDGQKLYELKWEEKPKDPCFMSISAIWNFANYCDLNNLVDLLDRQILFNYRISEVGLKEPWGASIGLTILNSDHSISNRMKAFAAAGSDARMSGCELPVVINSGSGNQGIAVSSPVVYYAKIRKFSQESLYRALVLSNLLLIYQRRGIGCLSAYCGVINAGISAICGVAYLDGYGIDAIEAIISNGLAIASGVICDGAKPSCASKIVLGVEAGIISYEMFKKNKSFKSGEGIVKENADLTISAVSRLGRIGMHETDREIMRIMLNL